MMKTRSICDFLTSSEMADVQAVADALAARRPVDAEVRKRVKERADQVRHDIRERLDTTPIAVDLIRQGRDE